MNAWDWITGKPRNGAVRATFVIATAAAAVLVLSGSEEWIATPLPDGTTMYLRYGAPEGVRIVRGLPAEAATPDSVALAAAARPGVTPSAVFAPVPEGWTDSLAAQVRRILAEELAALPILMQTRVQYEHSWAPPPVDTLVVLAPPTPPPSVPDTLGVPAGPRFAAPDSARIPPVVPAPESATIPPIPAPPTAHVQVPPESPRAELPPEPRTIREAFASDGLFTTQLLLFETGESELLPSSVDILRVVAGVLREFPEARVRVEGYTDPRGRAEANLDLSRRRAEAVRDFLAGEGGLGPDRVEAVGYGEERPLTGGTTPTALALNRRVQIRVLNPEALRRSVEAR